MKVYPLSDAECHQVLADTRFGRLGCARDNQPYVVPIYFVVGDGFIYSFALPGQKIQWMRDNPRVCIETDSVAGADDWTSVVVLGRYTELEQLAEFQHERERAHLLLQGRPMWWEPGAVSVEGVSPARGFEPIFFRVTIDQVSGYRALARSEEDSGTLRAQGAGAV